MPDTNGNPAWFALTVKPRHEKAAATYLDRKGLEAYLPTYRAKRRWSDRVKEITTPLFPGYVFCRFDPVHRLPILKIPGVGAVVGSGSTFHPVEERELANIRTLLASGMHCQPWPFVKVGETVSVERGPLAGVEGIVTRVKNEYRLVISVSLLQRSVVVEIDRDDVRPVANPARRVPPGSR
jgi:transcription antitermination factor NusG